MFIKNTDNKITEQKASLLFYSRLFEVLGNNLSSLTCLEKGKKEEMSGKRKSEIRIFIGPPNQLKY